MKRLTTLWMMLLMLAVSIPTSAMSMSKVRENARFLTDRMAYELNLTPMQYDDVYEVNFDFIDNVRHIMNDVVRGRDYAVDRYYEFLEEEASLLRRFSLFTPTFTSFRLELSDFFATSSRRSDRTSFFTSFLSLSERRTSGVRLESDGFTSFLLGAGREFPFGVALGISLRIRTSP